ncbi:MAG: acyl-CoA dehydrogenase family protein [Myxococcales bacterium]|nr:acyl-CoA dehydrogenase family protein [Myxococcales bacterium]
MGPILQLLNPEMVLPRYDDLADFWRAIASLPVDASSMRVAAIGGAQSDRLGFAFIAGYEAALGRLVGAHRSAGIGALCVTERAGNHPRAIATALAPCGEQLSLRGEKTFVTGGTLARQLFVLAVRDDQVAPGGQRSFALVAIEPSRAGVSIEALPPVGFVPEIPHALVRFDEVPIADGDCLPGDGYLGYVKPFRTMEDLHVSCAAAAYLLAVGRRFAWPSEMVLAWAEQLERWLSFDVDLDDPLDPALHLRLAGALAIQASLLRETAPLWCRVADDERGRFERDRAIFSVAERARQRRTAAALRALGVTLEI